MIRPTAIAIAIALAGGASIGNAETAGPLPTVPWPATDGLGRSLPTADVVGPPRPGRFVGIFYFLWHNGSAGRRAQGEGPYDVSKILNRDPRALAKPDSPLWGPFGAPHYWGEPLYGYYRGDDPWVLRRHAHALADAGVDVLIFDTTNAVTYPEIYGTLCEVFQDVRREGGRTPQIAFMVNTRAGATAGKIFRDLYEPNRHAELWFRWNGKPLMICDPAEADAELSQFFTLRRAHWPFTMVNTDRAWHWEATYPQPYGYVDDAGTPEQVNVSVAQNLRISDGKVTNMSDGNARGRRFHQGRIDASAGAINYGRNFQEQWSRALELDPSFVMITGWNEWIAGRFQRPGKPVVFVDQFDQEHSRDIEFARHGHLDHYYWQMVGNIRRYKGAAEIPLASGRQTIEIDGPFAQWDNVAPKFSDHRGETIARDHAGVGGLHYANHSGRNDLVVCQAASDDRNVYFYVRAAEALRPATDLQGLWLLIDSDRQASTGWEGYDLIVGRKTDAQGRWTLENHVEGWNWQETTSISCRRNGAELQLAVPRSALGPTADDPLAFDFKWVDNLQRPGDVIDLYLSGDAAPDGRFNYRFEER